MLRPISSFLRSKLIRSRPSNGSPGLTPVWVVRWAAQVLERRPARHRVNSVKSWVAFPLALVH